MDKPTLNAQNVVTMSDYQPETGYTAIAQIESYWEALRGDRLLPKRSEIDPRGIEMALEYAFILERIAPGIARLRIAGSHLNDLMGMEVRGMPLTAFFTPNARRQIADMLEEVFQMPAISTLQMVSTAGSAQTELNARMILLPLKSDLGDVSRVLGCFVSHGDIGLAPRRFDLIKQEVKALVPGHSPVLTDRSSVPASVAPEPVAGFAAPKVSFSDKDGKRRPPYLRLVKSDD